VKVQIVEVTREHGRQQVDVVIFLLVSKAQVPQRLGMSGDNLRHGPRGRTTPHVHERQRLHLDAEVVARTHHQEVTHTPPFEREVWSRM
jgi:hypothetical protein